MTTKLEEVLAEEWKASDYISDLLVKEGVAWEHRAEFADTGAEPGSGHVPESRSRVRVAVAVLGKRALALRHKPGCAWGAIVEEARRLG
jgi:hypothetical protein